MQRLVVCVLDKASETTIHPSSATQQLQTRALPILHG